MTPTRCQLVMRSRHLVGLAIACWAPTAWASPRPRGILKRIDNGHATLTLAVTTQSREPTDVVIPIELPVGTTATGLTYTMAGSDPIRALAFEASGGHSRYDGIVAQIRDPALLEADGDGKVTLHVFPVRRGEGATVVVELTASSLVRANELVHVDERMSLLAAPDLHEPSDMPRVLYTRIAIAPRAAMQDPEYRRAF